MPLHSYARLFCRLYPTWCSTGPSDWLNISSAGPSSSAGESKGRFPVPTHLHCADLLHGAQSAPDPAIRMTGNCSLITTSVTQVVDSIWNQESKTDHNLNGGL